MPSTPTTKSQVQAYKFVLRRMQSALVRKDAVMLHDPMRTHTRATIVGVCLAALGIVGFLVWGVLSPKPGLPTEDSIVMGKESGAIYVYRKEPKRLIPMTNLASARLLLLALSQQGTNGSGGTPPPNAGAGAASTETKPVTLVSDNDLKDVPRERKTGIVDGPELLPNDGQRISDNWAVCDQYKVNEDLPNKTIEDIVTTSVLAGVPDLGTELASQQAVLVRATNDKTYLIYRTPEGANIPNANTVRAEVDLKQPDVVAALNLQQVKPRRITTALLNAIPEAPKLVSPDIPNRGGKSDVDVNGLTIGSVFSVENTEGKRYYVVLQQGINVVKKATADLIRFSGKGTSGGERITEVAPQLVTQTKVLDPSQIAENTFPTEVPEVLNQEVNSVVCLGWNITEQGGGKDGHTAVYVGSRVPLPKDLPDPNYRGVAVSTPSADQLKINYFYMPPGRAAVVRGWSSKADFDKGPIYLISDRGVKYGVPDQGTAATLGLAKQSSVPDSIARLLPDGASLDTRAVLQSYDAVPAGAGTFPTSSQAPNAQGGG